MAAAITARNRPVHKLADRYLRDGLLSPVERLCFTVVLNLCGEHSYTDARRATIAQRMKGRSAADQTFGAKCLSSIKNYLRRLVDVGLVWIARGRIYIAALYPCEQSPAAPEHGNPPAEEQEPEIEQLDLFAQQPKNCPESDKNLAAPPIKDSDLNSAGGGGQPIAAPTPAPITAADVPQTPAVEALRAGGTLVPEVLHELRDAAVELVERCRRQVRRTRDVRDPGALLAYLVRAGVGAAPPATLDPALLPAAPPDSQLAPIWRAAIPQIAAPAWALDVAALLCIDDKLAVVVVTHIFAHDALEPYLGQIAAELAAQLGHTIHVELAIGAAGAQEAPMP